MLLRNVLKNFTLLIISFSYLHICEKVTFSVDFVFSDWKSNILRIISHFYQKSEKSNILTSFIISYILLVFSRIYLQRNMGKSNIFSPFRLFYLEICEEVTFSADFVFLIWKVTFSPYLAIFIRKVSKKEYLDLIIFKCKFLKWTTYAFSRFSNENDEICAKYNFPKTKDKICRKFNFITYFQIT